MDVGRKREFQGKKKKKQWAENRGQEKASLNTDFQKLEI